MEFTSSVNVWAHKHKHTHENTLLFKKWKKENRDLKQTDWQNITLLYFQQDMEATQLVSVYMTDVQVSVKHCLIQKVGSLAMFGS